MSDRKNEFLLKAQEAAGLLPAEPDRPKIDPASQHAHDADSPRARDWVDRGLAAACSELAALDEGSRNQTLNDMAFRFGQFAGSGYIDPNYVWEKLGEAAESCELPQREIDSILPRVIGEGAAKPRLVELEETEEEKYEREFSERFKDWSATNITPPVDGDTPGAVEDEPEFWQAREHLSIIQQFARARIVSPWAVLGGVLARVVCATYPSLVIPPITGGEMSLNLFVALTGASGTGKDASYAVAREAVVLPETLVEVQPGSGEGMAHAFATAKGGVTEVHTERVLFNISEIDTFAALSARKGATLTSVLRDCFGGAALGFAYADASKRLRIESHQYRMCLIAGVQPGRAGALLDDADGGTPQRFLWVPTIDPGVPDVTPEAPLPFVWKAPHQPMEGEFHHKRQQIEVCKKARDEIIANRKAVIQGKPAGKYDGHLLLTKLKAATALALLDGRTKVTNEDWRLADVVLRVSLATRDTVVEHRKAEARTINDKVGEKRGYQEFATEQARLDARVATVERVAKLVLKKIPGANESVTRGWIKQKMNSRDRHYVDDALDFLTDAGPIVAEGTTFRRAVNGE